MPVCPPPHQKIPRENADNVTNYFHFIINLKPFNISTRHLSIYVSMGKYCQVAGCTSQQKKGGVSVFTIPSRFQHLETFKQWKQFILLDRVEDPILKGNWDSATVCEKHFCPDQIWIEALHDGLYIYIFIQFTRHGSASIFRCLPPNFDAPKSKKS